MIYNLYRIDHHETSQGRLASASDPLALYHDLRAHTGPLGLAIVDPERNQIIGIVTLLPYPGNRVRVRWAFENRLPMYWQKVARTRWVPAHNQARLARYIMLRVRRGLEQLAAEEERP